MNELDRKIDELTRITVANYRAIEEELIYKVVEMLKKGTHSDNSVQYFLQQLDRMNVLNIDTLKIIAEMSGRPLDVIKNQMLEIGRTAYKLDEDMMKEAFEKGLISVVPEKIIVDEVVDQHVKYLEKNMKYIQDSTKSNLFKQSFNAINKAQLEVELGAKSPNQAITDAVVELAKKGIHSDSYLREGKEVHQSMEAVVARAVRTSFVDMVNAEAEKRAEVLGTDDWYVTQHMGARTTGTGFENHAQWQGKVYSSEEMVTVCGEGHESGRGFAGYNCRHRKTIFIKGVSTPPPPLLNMAEMERVYELEQRQRRYERYIRQSKRTINALKKLDTEESEEEIKKQNRLLRSRQKRIRDLISENEDVLRRDYTREKVVTLE